LQQQARDRHHVLALDDVARNGDREFYLVRKQGEPVDDHRAGPHVVSAQAHAVTAHDELGCRRQWR
jgi:hypothetical protein